MSESTSLPIEACLAEIIEALASEHPVVLKAPPGAGKTTGVPPEILRATELPPGQVLLAQPRRLAARSAAAQLARLMRTSVGDEVGYHVRYDRQASAKTRLLVLTYGMLLRRLQSDPLLEGVSCVMLDEFHERSLEADLALGMIERVRTGLRPDLRLVVMSATLDPAPLVSFIPDARAITSEGRMFPVEIRYRPGLNRQPMHDQIVGLVPEAIAETGGHILVFLPGVGEIRRVERLLHSQLNLPDFDLLPLYADLSIEEQDRVLRPGRRRKLILSTNVAETSVTIDGVTGVIDSGQARISRFDPRVGLSKLIVEPISQASADQRSGRAGRTAPGVCWRLWSPVSHRARAVHDTPEIMRADFAPAAIVLASWGEDDAQAFPWLDPPRPSSIDQSRVLLERLGAVADSNRITDEGRAMAEFPLHPRLAKLLLVASRLDVAEDAAIAAALLTERDPFREDSTSQAAHTRDHASFDIVDRVERVRDVLQGHEPHLKRLPAMRAIERAVKQLMSSVNRLGKQTQATSTATRSVSPAIRLRQSLLAAFPDRVARRRENANATSTGTASALMVSGSGVRLGGTSIDPTSELVLCLQVDSFDGEGFVRLGTSIDRSWLPQSWMRVVDEPLFNSKSQSVIVRRREYFLDLMLGESPLASKPSAEAAVLLAAQAKLIWGQAYPIDVPEFESLLARIDLLRRVLQDERLPVLDDGYFDSLRDQLAQGCVSLEQLSRAPWVDAVRSTIDYPVMQWIEQEAPKRLRVPSGNTHEIEYNIGQPPRMMVKLQELFGWHETPRIARGRQPIQLHLLGPNRRTEQITEDLHNFWKNTYAQVRKDLRGRYPKHHWPEDPFTATATPKGMKPRTPPAP